MPLLPRDWLLLLFEGASRPVDGELTEVRNHIGSKLSSDSRIYFAVNVRRF